MTCKYNKKLVTDIKLSTKVAVALCKKINELMLATNPNVDKKNLYTEEEIVRYMNNPDSSDFTVLINGQEPADCAVV